MRKKILHVQYTHDDMMRILEIEFEHLRENAKRHHFIGKKLGKALLRKEYEIESKSVCS
jgi:hypothetical protein